MYALCAHRDNAQPLQLTIPVETNPLMIESISNLTSKWHEIS